MRTIKGKVAVAVSVAVWTVAMGAAAALTYDLNRPLHARPTATPQLSSVPEGRAATQATSEQPAPEEETVIHVPPATIVGRAPSHPSAHPSAAAPKAPPSKPELVCEEWRSLDMGSGRVQVCQEPSEAKSLDAPER